MILPDLTVDEQNVFDQINSNNFGPIEYSLQSSEDTTKTAKTILHQINTIVRTLGKVWNKEHDMQGKLVGKTESFSSDSIAQFYQNCNLLIEMIS